MKRLIVFILCISMLASFAVLPAGAASEQTKENIVTDEDTAAEEDVEAEDAGIADCDSYSDDFEDLDEEDLAQTGWNTLTEAQFSSKLDQLRKKYPNGDIWSGTYYEYGAYKADTCWGYACQMMYEVFGAMFYSDGIYSSYVDYSGSNICAGDWVRIDLYGGYPDGTHSIFITKVTDSGVYYTDANGTGVYNQIRWEGYYSWAQFNSMFRWRVHLPGNNLKGSDTAAETVEYTIVYNANGGTGSAASEKVEANGEFTLKSNAFKRSGYTFAGYICRRSYDNTWYSESTKKWQSNSDIYDNEYKYKVYPQGNSYTLGTPWIGGVKLACTFTFYAQWIPDKSTVEFMDNYSGYNYILGSDLEYDYSDYIFSRDSSVYSVSVDYSERLNNSNSLKIVGKSAGSSGSDLAITTSTNIGWGNGYSQQCKVGDDGDFYLRFCAKSSVEGAKMYIRWNYSNIYKTVTLSTNWKAYTVLLPKNHFYGAVLHPYFDTKGTYYLNSLVMGAGAEKIDNVVAETGRTADTCTVTTGQAISNLPEPTRYGYTFLGWYTAAEGGERVTSKTKITASAIKLYAHWEKDVSYYPLRTFVADGHYYELYDNSMSWQDAEDFCESMGGHLITIDSSFENQLACDMISEHQGYCWIGLSYNKSAGVWQWVNGEKYSYKNWYKASYESDVNNGQYYAMMYPMDVWNTKYSGKWNNCVGSSVYYSYYCYYNSFFICEYDMMYYLGDADGSGYVDIVDATFVQRYVTMVDVPYDDDQLMNADVDGDDELTIVDATFIQRFCAALVTPYEIGDWI